MTSKDKIDIWKEFIAKPRNKYGDVSDNVKISENQQKDIEKYVKFLIRENSADKTIKTRIVHLKTFCYFVKKDFKEITRSDIEKFVDEKQKLKPSSFNVIKSHIKLFFKWFYSVDGKGEYPEIVKWIPINFIEPQEIANRDLISQEDVKNVLIPACHNFRDKCMISLLKESGARINEILSSNIEDVTLEDNKAFIKLKNSKRRNNQKTTRRLVLIDSYYYISEWMRDSSIKINGPLFINRQKKRMTYSDVMRLLKKIQKETNFTKKMNPHAFRHSAASDMSKILSDSELRVFGGWSKSSQIISRYTHINSDDVNDKRLESRGIVKTIPEIKNEIELKQCPRCNEYLDFEKNKFCGKCGMSLGFSEKTEQIKKEEYRENFDKNLKKMMKQELVKLKKELNLVEDKNIIQTSGKVYYQKGKKIFLKAGGEMVEIARNKTNEHLWKL